ncbi:MAG: sigma-70 family RNA polymerase sigma factor [Bacteroidota bacterium]
MLKVSHKKGAQYDEMDDESMLELYLRNEDLEILGQLYQRYMHLVFGVCMKYLKNQEQAQDETMNIFEVLIKKLPNQKVDRFKSWLYVVTKNHCLMALREQKRNTFDQNIDHDRMESEYVLHPIEEDSEISTTEELIKTALPKLNDLQRKCIELFYLDKKSYQQVSDETGFDLKKVKSQIQNGKRNLKKILEEVGNG